MPYIVFFDLLTENKGIKLRPLDLVILEGHTLKGGRLAGPCRRPPYLLCFFIPVRVNITWSVEKKFHQQAKT